MPMVLSLVGGDDASMKAPPERKGNECCGFGAVCAVTASMKALPKRKGNLPPPPQIFQNRNASMKALPNRKGNEEHGARVCGGEQPQ